MQGEQPCSLHLLWASYHSFSLRIRCGNWWHPATYSTQGSLFISLGKKFETIRLYPEVKVETELADQVLTETVRGGVDKKLSDVFAEEKMTVNQRIRKKYNVPRMTEPKAKLCMAQNQALWQPDALVSYLVHMAKNGFPLTPRMTTAFAWAISGKADRFWKRTKQELVYLILDTPENGQFRAIQSGGIESWSSQSIFRSVGENSVRSIIRMKRFSL